MEMEIIVYVHTLTIIYFRTANVVDPDHRIYSSISPISLALRRARLDGGWRRGCKFHGAPASFLVACLRKCHVAECTPPSSPYPAPHSPESSTTATCSSIGNLTPLCEWRRAVAEYGAPQTYRYIHISTVPNISIGVLNINTRSRFCPTTLRSR